MNAHPYRYCRVLAKGLQTPKTSGNTSPVALGEGVHPQYPEGFGCSQGAPATFYGKFLLVIELVMLGVDTIFYITISSGIYYITFFWDGYFKFHGNYAESTFPFGFNVFAFNKKYFDYGYKHMYSYHKHALENPLPACALYCFEIAVELFMRPS